jgi:hypothetical protein
MHRRYRQSERFEQSGLPGSCLRISDNDTVAAAAVAEFKSSPWIVVVALAGHGVFDAVHGHVIENAGVPAWWPAWCLAYDVGAAAGLGWLLRRELITNDASLIVWNRRR